MTREHSVSASHFGGEFIYVKGLPWCKDIAKRIPIATLTAKILCREHNTQLSAADGEQATTVRAFRELGEQRERRRTSGMVVTWAVTHRTAEGMPLERWFTKTTVNLALVYQCGWYIAEGTAPERPARRVVEAAVGMRDLAAPAGLHAFMTVGDKIGNPKDFEFMPLMEGDDRIIGGAFMFGGFRFLNVLTEEHIGRLRGRPTDGLPLRHPRAINLNIAYPNRKSYRSGVLEIRWPERPPLAPHELTR